MPYLLNCLYAFGLVVLSPWLIFRACVTGRYRKGLAQKLLGFKAPSNSNSELLVWFHGVSVGEIHLLVTVVKAFRQRMPHCRCVVSTTTDTGMAEAKRLFADLTVIYWPFDFSWAVKRTLRSLKPTLIVLAESELWPNFLHAAAKSESPVLLINGRMSPRSAARHRQFGWLTRPLLLSRITHFAMQSPAYAEALTSLGIAAKRITVTGSIKYDGVLGDKANSHTMKLRDQLGLDHTSLVWVAGSTHAPEEEIVLSVFQKLRLDHPHLILILVPRSADRFDEVAHLIEQTGLPFVRRSQSPMSLQPKAVILLDTIGELNAAWGLADVGFTGGSLDGKRGGQSMIEPAGLGVPVVFGPHIWNFRDAAARLIELGGAVRISDAVSMETELRRLLDDGGLRTRMGEAARIMVLEQQGATERTLDVIDSLLEDTAETCIAA